MPDYISNDGCGYTFQFQTKTGGSGENGGVLIFYMDFY